MTRDWKTWFKLASVRAIKTVAQATVGALGSAAVISEINFIQVISAAILAGVASLLTSLAGIPEEPTQDSDALGMEQDDTPSMEQ